MGHSHYLKDLKLYHGKEAKHQIQTDMKTEMRKQQCKEKAKMQGRQKYVGKHGSEADTGND